MACPNTVKAVSRDEPACWVASPRDDYTHEQPVVPAAGRLATGGRQTSAATHRDFGHLRGHVAAVADDLCADLDQPLAQAGQRPRLHRLRHLQRVHEITEVVGKDMELEADGVGGEGIYRRYSAT